LDKGAVIGTGGKVINKIRQESGAHCNIVDQEDSDVAVLSVKGTLLQVEVADKMVKETLAFANRPRWEQQKTADKPAEKEENWTKETKFIEVDKPLIAGVIGKGGCNLKEMGQESECKISFQLASEHDPSAPPDKQICVIKGFSEQVAVAERLVLAKVAEVKAKEDAKGPSWQASSWEAPKKEPCQFFLNGWCGYGDQCKMAHVGTPKETEWSGSGDQYNKSYSSEPYAKKESWGGQSWDNTNASGAQWNSEDVSSKSWNGRNVGSMSWNGEDASSKSWSGGHTSSNSWNSDAYGNGNSAPPMMTPPPTAPPPIMTPPADPPAMMMPMPGGASWAVPAMPGSNAGGWNSQSNTWDDGNQQAGWAADVRSSEGNWNARNTWS
jgi:hypothetical protein